MVAYSRPAPQKKLLGEEGNQSPFSTAKSSPRPMRVCVACAQSPNTFSFSASSDKVSTPRATLFSRKPKRNMSLCELGLRKYGGSSEGNTVVEWATMSIGKALSSPLQSLKSVRRTGSSSMDTDQGMSFASTMNCPSSSGGSSSQTSFEALHTGSNTSTSSYPPRPSPHDDDGPKSDVKFVEIGGTKLHHRNFAEPPPLLADGQGLRTSHERAGEAASGDVQEDSRITKLHKELKSSSYYQGLLQHEPAALKALTGAIFDKIRSQEGAEKHGI